MAGKTGKKSEIKKNWVAPELKKIDVEQITASGTSGGSPDGGTGGNSHS
ncbi:MAG: hypothetical protein ABSA42_10910 [Terracidiphilus sp.]|jgi:hypothetical protein